MGPAKGVKEDHSYTIREEHEEDVNEAHAMEDSLQQHRAANSITSNSHKVTKASSLALLPSPALQVGPADGEYVEQFTSAPSNKAWKQVDPTLRTPVAVEPITPITSGQLGEKTPATPFTPAKKNQGGIPLQEDTWERSSINRKFTANLGMVPTPDSRLVAMDNKRKPLHSEVAVRTFDEEILTQ